MCGIAGLVYFNKSRKVILKQLRDMTDTIIHRGPDDEGHFIDDNIGFGFRRLSIIDLNSGHQPMSDNKEVIWIVFNGEIYNYQSLRKDLISKGCIFKTDSDTEVIINCYKAYGEDCLSRLRGMFCFVIWDKLNNKIFAARDRFGIKPFYYLLNKDHFVFGSELKVIVQSGLCKMDVDLNAVDSYFTYGYIMSPYSIYKDVRKLQAGHYITIDLNKTSTDYKLKQYWCPSFTVLDTYSFDEYKEMLFSKLQESVKMHLVSDVTVGAFLSGGIDSSSVVSIASKLSIERLKTFTIGFKDEEYNESNLANQSSKLYQTEHHELILEPGSANMIAKIVEMYDEPFGDSSAIPTYFVSKLASEHVKVVLSGDGGDEFFGGYDSYKRLLNMHKYNIPNFLRKPLFLTISQLIPQKTTGKRFSYFMSKDKDLAYAYFASVYEGEKKKFFTQHIYKEIASSGIEKHKIGILKESRSSDFLSRMMELDIRSLLVDDILTKVDRASMANSLEVRVPIIDHEFFELASSIPSSMKLNQTNGKIIFKEAMKEQLTNSVYNHRKQGFTIPIKKWFKNDLKDWTMDSLSNPELKKYINESYLKKLRISQKSGSLITRIWPVLIFSEWLYKKSGRNFI